MARRKVIPLHVLPGEYPVQLVLGLSVGFSVLGKRSRARGKFVPGGFAMPVKRAEKVA